MNLIQSIVIKIANLVGVDFQQKETTQFFEEIPITKTISNKLSTLTLMDSDINIVGNGKRVLYMKEMFQSYI